MAKAKLNPKSPLRSEAKTLPKAERITVATRQMPFAGKITVEKVTVGDKVFREDTGLSPAHLLLLEKLTRHAAAETAYSEAKSKHGYAQRCVVKANDEAAELAKASNEASKAVSIASGELSDVLKATPDKPVKFGDSTFVYVTGAGIRRFKGEPMVLGGAA